MAGTETDGRTVRAGGLWELVIFDHDGVVVDSEPLASRAMSEVLADYGFTLSPHDVDMRYRGFGLSRTRAAFERETGRLLPATFERDYIDRANQIKAHELKPVPGIIDVLDRLDEAGLRYCMASSSRREVVETALATVGLEPRFRDKWWGAEDVEATKPAPDLFLLAAHSMGVPPAECVVVEDTPVGVAAGLAAGMAVLGFCASTPKDALADAGYIFESMHELPTLLGL